MKAMKIIAILSLVIFCSCSGVFAQKTSHPKVLKSKNVIAINVLGVSPGIGVAYERFVTSTISVEAGIGGNFWKSFDDIWSVGIGMKFYPFNKNGKSIQCYTGFSSVLYQYSNDKLYHINYLPIGISLVSQRNFHISLDIGPAYIDRLKDDAFKSNAEFGDDLRLYGGLKVGMCF